HQVLRLDALADVNPVVLIEIGHQVSPARFATRMRATVIERGLYAFHRAKRSVSLQSRSQTNADGDRLIISTLHARRACVCREGCSRSSQPAAARGMRGIMITFDERRRRGECVARVVRFNRIT